MGKLASVQEFIQTHCIHVMCITETHLLPSMPDSFIHIPNFRIIRNDVSAKVPKHGVCTYIHANLKFDCVDISFKNVISFCLPELKVFVAAVYRPPSYTPHDNDALLTHLTNFCTSREVIILGDFNLPSLSWDTSITSYVNCQPIR